MTGQWKQRLRTWKTEGKVDWTGYEMNVENRIGKRGVICSQINLSLVVVLPRQLC